MTRVFKPIFDVPQPDRRRQYSFDLTLGIPGDHVVALAVRGAIGPLDGDDLLDLVDAGVIGSVAEPAGDR